MSHPILVVCESPYDFDICARYIDRTIEAHGPDWAEGNLDAAREYIGIDTSSDVPSESFVRWGSIEKVTNYVTAHYLHQREIIQFAQFGAGLPEPEHHYCMNFERFVNAVLFDTKLYEPDAIILQRRVASQSLETESGNSQKPVAIILLLDADSDENRLKGLLNLNIRFQKIKVPIVIGVPDPETECWELAGFEHELTDAEAKQIDNVTKDLGGIHPIQQSHRLRAAKASDARHPKNVLSRLICDVPSRRKQCHDAPFDLLKKNGRDNGLSDFLDRLSNRTIPGIFGGKRE